MITTNYFPTTSGIFTTINSSILPGDVYYSTYTSIYNNSAS